MPRTPRKTQVKQGDTARPLASQGHGSAFRRCFWKCVSRMPVSRTTWEGWLLCRDALGSDPNLLNLTFRGWNVEI